MDITDATHVVRDGYTIKEAMAIYGLTVDALYYYEEKGLISPRRNEENGYRIFGAQDFYRLNVITELKRMGFSLDHIRSYLSNHTIATTMQLLNSELVSIDHELGKLQSAKADVLSSIQRYAHALSLAQAETITIQHIPARSCLLASQDAVCYDDIPYLYAKRTRESSTSIAIMHSTCCYVVDPHVVLDNGCFAPHAILLFSEGKSFENSYLLHGGLYAACTFRGALDNAPRIYQRIVSYVEEQGYEVGGLPIEFCLIGEYESDHREEYVSRIEVPVEARPA